MMRRFLPLVICLLLMVGSTAPVVAQGADQASQLAAAGRQALAQGRYDEARSDFEALAKLEPRIAEARATLAAIDFKLRRYDDAIREIKAAQMLKPGMPRLDSLLGLSLAELGRHADALPHLEGGFKQTADNDVRRLCGLQLLRAYTALDRDMDAVQTSLALNKLYPDDPEVLYHTSRIFSNYAYIVTMKLHDKAPNSVWMLQAQGEANESEKNYDQAIIAFNHVLALEPNRPGIHYRLGRIYLNRFGETQKSEDREAAQREFEAELAVNPSSGNARYELAVMQAEQGNAAAALKLYEDALARFPDFEEALVGLAALLLESLEPASAIAPLQRATRLRPDDEVAWYRLAQAQRAAGNKTEQEKALATFRKLHNSTPVTLRKPGEGEQVTPQRMDGRDNP